MDEFSHKDRKDHGFGSTNRKNTEFDDQLLKFFMEAIEAGNPEVLNRQFWSDYYNIILPMIPENQFITEFQSVSCQFGMDSITSTDQQMVCDSQLHRNHVYEGGRNNSPISFRNHNISNINDGIVIEMNLSTNFETHNNFQVAPLVIENIENDQGLILNSHSGYGIHGLNMASGSGNRLVTNAMQIRNTVHDSKVETNLLNYRMIADNTEGHIRSRQEISRTSGQFELTNSDNGVMYYDFESKNRAANNRKFDNTRFAGIYNAIPNIVQDDQEIQLLGNLQENRLDCAMSEYDPQHSLNLYKIPSLESMHCFQGNTGSLNNKDALECAHSMRQTGHFTAMEFRGQTHSSNIGISQNEDASSEI